MGHSKTIKNSKNKRIDRVSLAFRPARFSFIRLSARCLLLLSVCLSLACSETAFAYDAEKIEKSGLIRGDLSTWTQRGTSFSQNKTVSVNGWSALSSMGCSYYATFFMLCRMGIKNPLKDTAWQLAEECRKKKLAREGTGYFDPRTISKVTGGRVRFVEKGNAENYYDGLKAVSKCENQEELFSLMRNLMYRKGYFLVACCVGNVTNYQGMDYYSEGHYIFIDAVLQDEDRKSVV